MKIFIVHDIRSETYDRPHFFKTITEAVRAFELALKESDSVFSKYKEDFEMILVGDIDMDKAEVLSCQHQVICRGRDYVAEQLNLPLEDSNGKR